MAAATFWGICGSGRISNDFVQALNCLPSTDHIVHAVAARSEDSARNFASKHGIPRFFGSYSALFQDPKVQVVYIGVINPEHFPLAKEAILRGKHVLCEKPMCISSSETKELIALAKAHGAFLMEGIWSRFFPAYAKLSEELSRGSIGEVLSVSASLGAPLSEVDNCRLKTLGGGSMLNLGIYCVQLATLVFGKPKKILSAGHLNQFGVDESLSVTLEYEDGKIATLMSHIRVGLMNDAVIAGTQGSIKIPAMFVCPSELQTPQGILQFDLPKVPEGMSFNYPQTEGLAYEAEEVRRCLLLGLQESSKMPWDESLLIAEIMESALSQIESDSS